MKVLITSGGTEEPIDGVRAITNFSSGKTGAVIADLFYENGADVVLLHSYKAVKPVKVSKMDSYRTFNDLALKLKKYIATGNFDAVIHLAAVSDFSVDYIETNDGKRFSPELSGKIPSEAEIKICLKKNFKILDRLKDYCTDCLKPKIVGFKLTDSDSQQEKDKAIEKAVKTGCVDFLVHNNLRDINLQKHPAKIYSGAGKLLFELSDKSEIALKLFELLQERKKI